MDSSSDSGAHRQFDGMAVAHVLGGLDETAGRVFRAHLVDCPDCRARVGELRSIASELAVVEQAERRVRAAKAVDMKSREEAEPSQPRSSWRARWTGRLLFFGVMLLVMGMAAYTFALRTHVGNLETSLAEQRRAGAALEFGDALQIDYAAPDSTATAKVYEGDLVVVVDGVGEQVHGLYLLQGTGSETRTLRREPMRPTDGRLFFLVRLRGDETRVVVTEPSQTGLALDPSDGGSSRVLEATLPVPGR